MTTEHLDVPEELDGLLGGLGKAALGDDDSDLDTKIEGEKTHREHIIVGASVLVQRTDDAIDELEAEKEDRQEQRSRIRDRARMWGLPSEPAAPVSPETPPVLCHHAPPEGPVAPAAVTVTMPPTEEVVVPVAPPRPNRFNPRHYTRTQWVGAIVGAIIGLLIWASCPDWAGRNIENVIVQGAVDVLWFIAILGSGFFVGGLIGYIIETRSADDE